MATDDVRRGLRVLAAEAPHVDTAVLLAGVDAANRSHRRRVAAAAATGLVAVVVTAALAVPQVWNCTDVPTLPADQTAGTTGDGRIDATPLPTQPDHEVRFLHWAC